MRDACVTPHFVQLQAGSSLSRAHVRAAQCTLSAAACPRATSS